jgi:hypothetical protein
VNEDPSVSRADALRPGTPIQTEDDGALHTPDSEPLLVRRMAHYDGTQDICSSAPTCPMPDKVPALTHPPEGYADWLADLKARTHAAQQRAALALNIGLLRLYWQIARDILDRQAMQGWGGKVIGRLSHDLRQAFLTSAASPGRTSCTCAFAEALAGGGNRPAGCWTNPLEYNIVRRETQIIGSA